MNKHYDTIAIILARYKDIIRALQPKDHYHLECERIDKAMEWLDDQLSFLDDYRSEARESINE